MSAVALLCALGFVAGCGGGDAGVEPVAKPKAATPSPEARRAVADPSSAANVVARYWRSVQREELPLTLSLYSGPVVDAVGLLNFAGMLAAQRAATANARLNVLAIKTVAGGTLVTAEALPKTGAKVEHSFFLRRQENGWRLLYDTLAAAGIRPYVQDQTQRGINPSAPAPSARAVRAGDQALDRYRKAALSRLRVAPRP